jgi:circadian clock protein KaiC
MRRSINVLKMRGSPHDSSFREFTIHGEGMHIGERFHDINGILTGNPQLVTAGRNGGDEDEDADD